MYADQPTGLGADEVIMRTAQKQYGEKFESVEYLWIDAVEKWRKSGSRGEVPGLKEKTPVIYSEQERVTGKAQGRDYAMRKTGYLLRPEVCYPCRFFLLIDERN